MKYNIMCGGKYNDVSGPLPRHLTVLNGEPLVGRTIRLLKENGIKAEDIIISISDEAATKLFEPFGVQIFCSSTTYTYNVHNKKTSGYGCDGIHDYNDSTTYLFGDVYFTDAAIKKIVEAETDDILFFGSAKPFVENYIKPQVEAFGFKVVNRDKFFAAIKEFMQLQDEDKFGRDPISFDLGAVIKGVPVEFDYFKKQTADIFGEGFVRIEDYTCDVDSDADIVNLERAIKEDKTINHNKPTKIFGIISYLPDEEGARNQRKARLEKLFNQLGKLWPKIPVLLVTQNGKGYNPKTVNNQIRINYNDGIGILNARRVLRREFLKLKCDYLIMFDDDAIIECQDSQAHIRYMEEIDKHQNGFCFIKGGNDRYCPYAPSQFNLCAISRYILEKEEMPDIDPQKNQGFEDKIFSTLLHCKYPKNEFNIPAGIRHIHFKNPNINSYGGEVPSTWAAIQKHNGKQLYDNTDKILKYITEHKELPDLKEIFEPQTVSALPLIRGVLAERIDLVVPYVDSTKAEGIRLFNHHSPKKNDADIDADNRFRATDEMFKYFFRCVEHCLPGINNVFLLVQNKEQVPDGINTDRVRVITHDQFIPYEFLPSFSSSTIEMFLWNIPGLSKKFLYANDDFFIFKQTKPEDGFGPDRKTKFYCRFSDNVHHDNLYHNLMMSNVKLITPEKDDCIFSVWHSFRPYYKSRVRDCFFKYQDKIEAGITRFRGLNNNNCYLFNYYDYVNGYYEKSDLTYDYYAFSNPSKCVRVIKNKSFDVLVINDDTKDIPEDAYNAILDAFNQHFPTLSKYEVGGSNKSSIAARIKAASDTENRHSSEDHREKVRRLIRRIIC